MTERNDQKPISGISERSIEVHFVPLPPTEVFRRSERLKELLFQGAVKYAQNQEKEKAQ